ncbi:hypothetical protein FB45DRAFT_749808 [Roridomyces roridus]|uniref:Uncharacterized protein n=1 Tax=Roridomyces roridus TaxID=1738132 RepID=A0AAD7FM50_9AGAR|nr:hypothetical protein FB45DRAFT_749808 [Roridomyces roridus]
MSIEYRVLTVHPDPNGVAELLTSIVDDIKDKYTVVYVGNVESIEDVKAAVEREKANVLFTASVWTAEEVEAINDNAKSVAPDVHMVNLPKGLAAKKGSDGVIAYIKENIPGLLA